ncbi:hypothetical protein CH272_10610 [Rhodococcus sp. 05-340-1]|nr:hypothetical protein CH271_28055 [Rhodococcus sp. 05-340-2]OZD79194.1 hypothetical protein CH272_10610 [Rhodococcus sp. 05-340-1]
MLRREILTQWLNLKFVLPLNSCHQNEYAFESAAEEVVSQFFRKRLRLQIHASLIRQCIGGDASDTFSRFCFSLQDPC